MTTSRARLLLKCTRRTLERMARDGRLRKEVVHGNRTEWNDQDVLTLAGMDPEAQLTVVYARTEPLETNTAESAESRLEEQKKRLLKYCDARDISVDMVIGEVRRVNRIRDMGNNPAAGFNALMALLADRRIGRLVIESRDRISVGASWEMFEWIFKSYCGCEILVVNPFIFTTESREESKYWIADMLKIHKIATGEIRDKKLKQQFVGGPDVKTMDFLTKRLDRKLREAKKVARDQGAPGRKKRIVDLEDVFG